MEDRRTARASDVRAVVDREQLAVPFCGGREGFQKAQLVPCLEALLPQLDDVDTTGEDRVEKVIQITLTLPGISTQIQPRLRKPGTGPLPSAHADRRYAMEIRTDGAYRCHLTGAQWTGLRGLLGAADRRT